MKHTVFFTFIGLFLLFAGCGGKDAETDTAKEEIRVVEVGHVATVTAGTASDGRPVFLIPSSALFMRGQLEGVQVVGDDDIVWVRWVRTGDVSGNEIEVLTGLEEGEKVVAPCVKELQEGYKVTVKQ